VRGSWQKCSFRDGYIGTGANGERSASAWMKRQSEGLTLGELVHEHLSDAVPGVLRDDPLASLVTELFPEIRTLVQMHNGAGDFREVLAGVKSRPFPVRFDQLDIPWDSACHHGQPGC